jgi:N-formylglutamate deformylase
MILHLPHSSSVIPDNVRKTFVLSDEELKTELLAITDAFTDVLFSDAAGECTRIVYPVSRLVADPERFLDDSQEEMSKCGMGVVYTRTSGGRVLRNNLTQTERQALVDRFYIPHHKALHAATEAELRSHGRAIVIDCHSFPSIPLPYETCQDLERPDICIGTDDYHTPQWLADNVVSGFEAVGLSVNINRPFSGSIVPSGYYRKDNRVHSLMVEINRRLYMDERAGDRNPHFEEIREMISAVLGRIRPD